MSHKISRRSAIGRIAKTGLLAGAGFPTPRAFASPKQQATAFALAGDRCHNIDYIRTALGKTLGKDLGLSIDFRDELGAVTEGHPPIRAFKVRTGPEGGRRVAIGR